MAVQREQVIRTAEKYVSKGRIEAAIREYRKVLKDHPGDANTLNRLGDLYARIQRFDEAVELFQQIAEHYTHDGFFVKAIAIYKKIIKLDPTRLEIYESLAGLYHKQGLVNEARTQYQVLADYYIKHDNSVSAAAIYQKMVDLEPDNPSHHAKLAELYTEQKLLDKAMEEYATIARLMISHGHAEEATQVYIRALGVDATDVGFITDAVMKLREAGYDAEAARFLSLAVERNPEAERVARLAGMAGADTETATETAAETAGPAPDAAQARTKDVDTRPGRTEERKTSPGVAVEAAADERVDLVVDLEGVDLQGETPPSAYDAATAETTDGQGGAVPAGAEIELDLDEVFVLDLDDDEPPPSQVQPPPDMLDGRPATAFGGGETEPPPPSPEPASPPLASQPPPSAPSPSASDTGVEIDPEFLERTTAELEPRQEPNEGDLVSEAEVLAKYGLVDKAVERLEEALEINGHCLEAHELLVRIHMDQKSGERIPRLARRMARAAAEAGALEVWERTRSRLEQAGYRVEGTEVAPPPARQHKAKGEDRVNRLLSDLVSENVPRRKAARPPQAPPPAPPPAEASRMPPHPAEDDITLHGIFDEVQLEETPAVGAGPPDTAPLDTAPTDAGETGAGETGTAAGATRWLDELGTGDAAAADEAAAFFEDEGDFFDLAGELEQELTEEVGDQEPLLQTREQTLEEIVEGFKKGVAENLSPEDYNTHFNLGIAYREMGLIDEAIGEFQIAAKDRGHLVECCSMLGLSFLEKGLPELAVKWYRQGLAAPDLSEEESLGLLYDMGNTYLAIEDREAARKTFVEVYGINSNYRDVVAKLEELR